MNFRIRKIEAEKVETKEFNGKVVNAKSNFTISSIKKAKDARIGEYLDVNFEFEVTYEPLIGTIKSKGGLWYYAKNLNKLFEEKQKKIHLKREVANEISTAILQESILNSIEIAKKLRLPIPIKLPKVEIKQEKMQFNKAS